MRVLLLGATGFIGSGILRELLAAGHGVLALARSGSAAERLRRHGAEVVRGDLREPGHWAAAVRDVDAVIHAAATFSEDMGEVDRIVVRVLTEHAMDARRRILAVRRHPWWRRDGRDAAASDYRLRVDGEQCQRDTGCALLPGEHCASGHLLRA